ncbi:uncharacterized protein V6R79_023735 [Siganus canaliculatus]
MEESHLLKERLQAITEKHRIQEDIRQKKLELDQEKLRLQHLKKKALREQWLLQDAASPQRRAALSDQHKTRALQLSIHRMELEVQRLEREEVMVSTNEGFILNRLKAVERSSEDIIKEVQDSFLPEPFQVTAAIPDLPRSPSPPADQESEAQAPRQTLFAMEINVTKNLLTGESTVVSTAAVSPEEVNQHSGLKVYDDGRKCVYALNSPEGSHDQSSVSVLSANEVEHLLRSATLHRQTSNRRNNHHQNHRKREERCFGSGQEERGRVESYDARLQSGHDGGGHDGGSHDRGGHDGGGHDRGGHDGKRLLRNELTEKDFSYKTPSTEHHWSHVENQYRRQEERNNQSNLRGGRLLGNYQGLGNRYGNPKDEHHGWYQVRNCVQEHRPGSRRSNGVVRSNSWVSGSRGDGRPLPRSHDQKVAFPDQSELCYTPANYIPLRDYLSVDDEELYCFCPPDAASGDSAHSDRVPSPLYGDDTPFTILSAMDTTEPITAVFMGFQTAQDDSAGAPEFDGSLTAELVVIGDGDDVTDDVSVVKEKMKKSHAQLGTNGRPTGSWTNGSSGPAGAGDRRVGPGIRKIQKKHKACCAVC